MFITVLVANSEKQHIVCFPAAFVNTLKNELKKLPEMNNLDLAYEVSTKEIYLWKNGRRKKISSEKIGKEKFIACIDFTAQKSIELSSV